MMRMILILCFLIGPPGASSAAGEEPSMPLASPGCQGLIASHECAGEGGPPLDGMQGVSDSDLARITGKGAGRLRVLQGNEAKIILWDEGCLQYALGVGFLNLGNRLTNAQFNRLVTGGN